MPGPIAKRSVERRRRNASGDVDTISVIGAVRVPPMPRDWDPLAKQLFRACKDSGQAVYFEPSDWAAVLLAGTATSQMLTCAGSGQAFVRKRRAVAPICPRCRRAVVVSGTPATIERHRRTNIVAEMLHTVWDMWKDLLISESARRRARIEIDRQVTAPDSEKVTAMAEYQERIGRQGVTAPDDEADETEDDE